MNKAIIWIHGDCLNPGQTALRRHPHTPAIFVWDDDLLRWRRIALKRILFIYECLLDLPVIIRRGQVAREIITFAKEHKTRTVITTGSVSPGFERICRRLREQGLELIITDEEPFVDLPQEPDLRRFSRTWRAIRKALEED